MAFVVLHIQVLTFLSQINKMNFVGTVYIISAILLVSFNLQTITLRIIVKMLLKVLGAKKFTNKIHLVL